MSHGPYNSFRISQDYDYLTCLTEKKKNLPASITYIQITAETRKSLLKKFITVNPLFMLPTFFFPFTVFKV